MITHLIKDCVQADAALLPVDDLCFNSHNGSAHRRQTTSLRKQRVTITLPVDLLERLRNAVYWKGHGTLAHLITASLDEAVTHMERANGGPFAIRLAPLKRGRPRHSSINGSIPLR